MPPSPMLLKWARQRLEGSGSGAFAPCWRAPLAQLVDDEEIRDEDIVTEESSVTGQGLERVWKEILEAAVSKMLDRDKPSNIGFARALSLALVPIDGGVTKEAGPDGISLTPSKESAAEAEKKGPQKDAASGEEAMDMLSQGTCRRR